MEWDNLDESSKSPQVTRINLQMNLQQSYRRILSKNQTLKCWNVWSISMDSSVRIAWTEPRQRLWTLSKRAAAHQARNRATEARAVRQKPKRNSPQNVGWWNQRTARSGPDQLQILFFFCYLIVLLFQCFQFFFSHISMNDRCSSSKTSCSGARTSAADHWPMSGNRRPRDATPSKRNWPKRSDRTGLASPSWSTNFRSRGTARWLCSRRKTKSWPIYATCSSKLETVLHQRLITEATLPQPGAQNRGLIRLLLSLPWR